MVSAFPLRDDPQQRIDHVFQPVAHVIDDARSRGGATALVCAQGISRSAACALAYLILREGLTLDEALSDAREARPIIAPNCAFIDALTRLERKVRVGLTNDMFSVVKRVADPEKRQKQRAMAAAARLMKKNQQLYDNDLEPKYDQKMEVSSPKLCAEYFNPSTPRNRNFNLATATLLTYHRPFVAVSAEHHAQIDPGDVLAKVVVVERAHRKGVIVWFGASSDRDVQLAGQRLARMIAKQQVADQERFRDPSGDGEDNNEHMIKDNAFGEAPEVSSRIEVRLQGLHPNFDDRIVQELTECKR